MAKEINLKTLKTLRRGPNKGFEDEVVLLHVLLNKHIDTDLPIDGSDAAFFGPRTEAAVKLFQEKNRIDKDTKDFKDGIVGPHTWKELTEMTQATTGIVTQPG